MTSQRKPNTFNTPALESFIESIDSFLGLDGKTQVDYIAYYFLSNKLKLSITAKDIEQAFSALSLKPYSRTSAYLSESSKKKNGKYIKQTNGYILERKAFLEIRRTISDSPEKIEVNRSLIDLANDVRDKNEKAFLEESISCFRIKAFRSFMIMIWILTLYHLRSYVLCNKLTDFNLALSGDKDKSIRVRKISIYDDFSDLKEEKFIELLRVSRTITNDIRKILDQKLGIRNTYAHPSSAVLTEFKATEFGADLIENVLLKY
jgi:hypothetical protein